jgi:uncharacterized membrane protein YfcA
MVHLGAGELALLGGAGFLAGGVNAVAGGGSLISFPALLGVGYPSVPANVTNNVALLPGYVGGTLAYRDELRGQGPRARRLAATSAVGGLAGAVLLNVSPPGVFEAIVPFLILLSCALLVAQPAASRAVERRGHQGRPGLVHASTLLAAVYGGYFGAGLGIMLLAALGAFLPDDLQRLNALKGLLSLVISAVAVVYFALFAPVVWAAAAVMAATSLAGGQLGVRAARRLSATALRWTVVVFGTAVAIVLLVT